MQPSISNLYAKPGYYSACTDQERRAVRSGNVEEVRRLMQERIQVLLDTAQIMGVGWADEASAQAAQKLSQAVETWAATVNNTAQLLASDAMARVTHGFGEPGGMIAAIIRLAEDHDANLRSAQENLEKVCREYDAVADRVTTSKVHNQIGGTVMTGMLIAVLAMFVWQFFAEIMGLPSVQY